MAKLTLLFQLFMNQEYSELMARLGPFISVSTWIAIMAIPVALLLIWNQLGRLNENLEIQRTLENAREETRRGRA